MKRLVIIMLLLTAIMPLSNTVAQSRLSEQQREELLAKVENYRKELNLSERQQEQVKAINRAYYEELEALQRSGGSRISKLKKFRALSEVRDRQMKEVLDPGQYERYRKMQEEMRSEVKSRRKQ